MCEKDDFKEINRELRESIAIIMPYEEGVAMYANVANCEETRPSMDEFLSFVRWKGFSDDEGRFVRDLMDARGWRSAKEKAVKNWKQSAHHLLLKHFGSVNY